MVLQRAWHSAAQGISKARVACGATGSCRDAQCKALSW
ncbi:Uncharacterised protein [Vibrio cholerae]|nr:Uncharacterised protein [Vibrio cholerae]